MADQDPQQLVPVPMSFAVVNDQSVTAPPGTETPDPAVTGPTPVDRAGTTPAGPPVLKSPFSVLSTPAAATAAGLGALFRSPGDLYAAGKAAFEAAKQAPYQWVADQPSPSKVAAQYSGTPLSFGPGLMTDVMLDPMNVMGEDPLTSGGRLGLAALAATPDMIERLEKLPGLVSKFAEDILPTIGKKGISIDRLWSLIKSKNVPKDELTPGLMNWLEANKGKTVSKETLQQALWQHALPLSERYQGQPGSWAALSPEIEAERPEYTGYVLPGGEDTARNLLIGHASGIPFDPTQTQWRQVTGADALARVHPNELYAEHIDVPELPADEQKPYYNPSNPNPDTSRTLVWEGNDPQKTRIVFDPTTGTFRLDPNSDRDTGYSSFENAMAAYHAQAQDRGNVATMTRPGVTVTPSAPNEWQVRYEGHEDQPYRITAETMNDRPWIGPYSTYTVFNPEGVKFSRNSNLRSALNATARERGWGRDHTMSYTAPHFDAWTNALAHGRMTDRYLVETLPDGTQRVMLNEQGQPMTALNAEEGQADIHTHESGGGRYYGYLKPNGDWLPPDVSVKHNADGTVTLSIKALEDHKRLKPIVVTAPTEAQAYADLRTVVQSRVKIPPDTPFKGGKGDELAFKRMLYQAVKENKDAFTWTTGSQQARRYNNELANIIGLRWSNGSLEAELRDGGWTSVQGRYETPDATARVIGDQLAAQLKNAEQKPRWDVKVTDPEGDEVTHSFDNEDDANKKYDELREQYPQGEEWDDLSSRDQDRTFQKWYAQGLDNGEWSDEASDAASDWLQDELNHYLYHETDDDVHDTAKQAVMEEARRQHIDLDEDSIDEAWAGNDSVRNPKAPTMAYPEKLRTNDGESLTDEQRYDLVREYDAAAETEFESLRDQKEEDLRESDGYYERMNEAEYEAAQREWSNMDDEDRLRHAVDFGIAEGGSSSGYEIETPELVTRGGHQIDISGHPITIASKGMEQQYDQRWTKLAQWILDHFGAKGEKVGKMMISGEPLEVRTITKAPTDERGSFGMGIQSPDSYRTNWVEIPKDKGDAYKQGQYVIYDPNEKRVLSAASSPNRDDVLSQIEGKMGAHTVWGIRLTPALKEAILKRGLPLASILFPVIGSTVTLKNGQRVRVTKHNDDDGTFEGRVK